MQSPASLTLSTTARVRVVAEEVARQTGLRVEVSRAVPDHALIVSLQSVSADEALKRIAWAVYGQVESEGDLRRIVPDSVAINRAKREYREWRIERNRNLAARLSAALLGAQETSPSRRAIGRLLRELPPERWIDSDPLGRLYSTSPTRMQRPMPAGFLPAYQTEVDQARTDKKLSPVKVRKGFLVFSNEDQPRIQHIAFSAQTEGGGLLSENDSYAHAEAIDPEAIVPPLLPKEVEVAVPEGTEIEWSKPTEAFVNAMMDADVSPPKETVDLLSDPLRIDPLTFGVRDVYEALGRRAKASVVVNVSDANIVNLFMRGPADLRESIRRVWSPFARLENGWIVDRPPVARPEWPYQVDRESFARFMNASRQPGRDPFDARLAFLSESGLRATWGLVAPFINLASGESSLDTLAQPGLQLLAFLPPASRRHLDQGGTLATRAMPEDAQAILWTRLNWEVLHPPATARVDVTTPFSEVFPNGLPAGTLKGRELLQPYLRVWETGKPQPRVIACNEFATHRTLKPTRLEPLWRPTVQLRIQFEGDWSWANDVPRPLRSAGQSVTSESVLPAAHQEAIAKART